MLTISPPDSQRRIVATFDFTDLLGKTLMVAVAVRAISDKPDPDKLRDHVRRDLRLMMRNAVNYRDGLTRPEKSKALKAGEKLLDDFDLGPILGTPAVA